MKGAVTPMRIRFEHDYQQKVMTQTFEEATRLHGEESVMQWRQLWLDALKSWHSPYKALIDGRLLELDPGVDHEKLSASFKRMEKVLSGFFLKKACVFGCDPQLAALLPFDSFPSEEGALEALGLKRTRSPLAATDFRGSIQLQNHFRQHVVELSFQGETRIDSMDQLNILRSKLTNNLMQWHSSWNLLVDCSTLTIDPALFPEFEKVFRFFRGFFLKEVLGYQPIKKDLSYPFQVYRARHQAAGRLEAEGLFSGEDANCRSRKGSPTT